VALQEPQEYMVVEVVEVAAKQEAVQDPEMEQLEV